MMWRLFPLVLLALTLTACGSSVRLLLTFDTQDRTRKLELLQASQHVIERRLSRFDGAAPEEMKAEEQKDGTFLLAFAVKNAEARRAVVEELLRPFSLQIMLLSTSNAGDLYVEEQGWFTKTGITQKHITWTEGGVDETGKGRVRLTFSEEGRALLSQVIRVHPNGIVGLFVRDNLMSKMQIEGAELRKEIVITGIPTPDIATIFADDVNVGTHVTFSLPSP